ncbi:MAG: hypothetical protein R3C45_04995 [Phycisphaerales bacterium]
MGNWNQDVNANDPLQGDPSGDGFVGIEDLNTVLGNWNIPAHCLANANILRTQSDLSDAFLLALSATSARSRRDR